MPYSNLPKKSYWKTAIANNSLFDLCDIWEPRFKIEKNDFISTFGSCFAQHISKALIKNGYSWVNSEKSPPHLSLDNQRNFNYGIFSCRTGNIYTTTLLSQWLNWAIKPNLSPTEEIFKIDNSFFDPFRPRIEPLGFSSEEELLASRKHTILSLNSAIKESKIFIFTLGLTEHWLNSKLNYEYPICPGTINKIFNKSEHEFKKHNFESSYAGLKMSIDLLKEINPGLKIILTVSPVPLTASYSKNHIAVATMESKSILRSIASEAVENHDFIDYFPSYEIINSPFCRGIFFDPNMRNVNQYGVNFVMKLFFQSIASFDISNDEILSNNIKDNFELECDEIILEASQKLI